MYKILTIVIFFLAVSLTGCAKFNPRNTTPINNDKGKIDEVNNNQGIMTEIGKLKQSAELQNSQLKEVQNGLVNLNASLSRNENSGVQILQGDGALILVFSILVVGMILYWYRDRAIKSEKASSIMAREVVRLNNPNLNDNILRSAMNTESEAHVYHLLVKHKLDLNNHNLG